MTTGTPQLAADLTDIILDARGVEVTIDGTAILHGVDLSVRRGEIHVLIGPNGAGKTTFANAITGHVAVTGGDIALDGVPLTGSISKRARNGIGRKFQVPRIFKRLSVAQNLSVASNRKMSDNARAADLIDVGDSDANADSLAHGARQRLEMKMVLSEGPAIAVLDEPTAGMTRSERTELAAIVREQAGHQTFLIVEHDMDFVAEVADRVSFMQNGLVIACGTFSEIAENPVVQEAYLGTTLTARDKGEKVRKGGERGALRTTALSVRRGNLEVVRNASLDVPAGTALGVLGRNGAGKTTLLLGLMGLLPTSGDVEFEGQKIVDLSAWKRARGGIALVPQGRQLFADLTVQENLNLATFDKGGDGKVFDVNELFPALAPLSARRAGLLSGGEQQQVAIARALLRRPTLLILDEPTEGLAPAIIEEIAEVLRFLSSEGLSIVLAEQHRSVVEAVCDTFLVLRSGEIVGAGPADPQEIDQHYLAL